MLLALGLLALSSLGPQEPYVEGGIPSTGRADPRLTIFDAALRRLLREGHVPGATLAVSKDGRLVYARGFGYADLEAEEVMQPDALMRIASLTKPVTSAMIFLLAQEGALDLDDPLLEHLPAMLHGGRVPPDTRWADITLRQLLQHRGGFDRKESGDPMFRTLEIARETGVMSPIGMRLVIRSYLHKPLDFTPGERFAYSNFGYTLLGRVIEHASGESYENEVRTKLLAPLGLKTMRIGKTLLKDRAVGEVIYHSSMRGIAAFGEHYGKQVRAPYGTWSQRAADSYGGWIASAPELLLFARVYDSLAGLALLDQSSIEQTFARPPTEASESGLKTTWYACGWEVQEVGGGRIHAWHTGSLPGSAALMVRLADGIQESGIRVTSEDSQVSDFDRVVITVPATNAADLCPGLSVSEAEQQRSIEYVGIVCASLLLKRPLSSYYITNITDAWVPFTAVIEMSALVDRERFAGNSLIYLPKYASPDDPIFSRSDQALKDEFVSALCRMHPSLSPDEILDFKVSRVRRVFALPTIGYSDNLPPTATSIRGLHIVNSSHIVNGTLNVNETIELAERTLPSLLDEIE